jgi:hypothetical protein
MTKRIHNQLKANLKNSLSKASTDLEIMLDRVDLLDSEGVNSKLKIYEKTIHNIQNDFIAQISAHIEDLPETMKVDNGIARKIPVAEIGAGALAGGAAVAGGNLILISQTSGWWIFSKTVEIPLAVFVGNAIGIPASVATGGIAVIGGAAGYIVVRKAMKSFRKKSIYNKIQTLCDKAEQDVLDWAEKITDLSFKEVDTK